MQRASLGNKKPESMRWCSGGAESARLYDGWSNKKAISYMSGTRITEPQVRLYMYKRKHHSQEIAAAKAELERGLGLSNHRAPSGHCSFVNCARSRVSFLCRLA